MSKQVIYLELSKGNVSNGFNTIIEYKYGTGEEFKTFTSAMKQAQKDFKKEAQRYLTESLLYIGVRNALQIIAPLNEGFLIHNQIEINS